MIEHPESPAYSRWRPMALAKRWQGADREHHEIMRGMVWVAFFVFLGKLAGAGKEMVVAWRYGVSAEVDAYLFLLNIVSWPVSLWFSVLAAVLIPLVTKVRESDRYHLERFHAELLGRTLLLGFMLALLSAVLISALLKLSLTGLSSTSLQAADKMILPMALLAPLGTVAGLFSIWMLANGRHANTLLESVPALVIALSVALLGNGGIEALTWGTLAGFACHAITLAIPLKRELRAPRLSGRSPQWSAFWTGFSIMLVGQAVMSLTGLIDQFFVTRLAEGALSTLNYAQRILALILGLGATAIGRATIPIFARTSDGDHARLHRITIRWARIVFLLGAVAVVFGWWLAPWAVKLLFERGAFTAHDTEAVVAVFRCGMLQIPFNVATVILFYALAGRREFGALTKMAIVALLVKIIANALLVPTWGISGIMFGTGWMYAALMLMYLFVFNRSNG